MMSSSAARKLFDVQGLAVEEVQGSLRIGEQRQSAG